MAQIEAFDINDAEPLQSGFALLPEGLHVAVIISSETKQSRNGNGSYMEFVHEILDGPSKGRKYWERLPFGSPKPAGVNMARSKLAAMCRALGIAQIPTDSAVLHNKPLCINIGVKLNKDNGKPENVANGWEPVSEYKGPPVAAPIPAPAAPAVPVWQQQAAPAAAPAAPPAKAPWAK